MLINPYFRVSSEEQLNGYSIDAQRTIITEWATANSHTINRVYIEPGLSAKTDNRPIFQQALKDTLSGPAQWLVVHKFDRFARNVLDSRLYKQLLRTQGKDIISVSEPIDDSPAGFLQEGILELFAEYYIINLGAEVRKGLTEKARQGLWPGRDAPYGYKRVRNGHGSFISVSNDGAMITEAFESFATGNYTLSEWAIEAYERGFRSQRTRKKIHPQVWQKIFRNKFYLGLVVWNGQEFEGQHIPLINDETFVKVQAVLTSRARKQQGAKVKHPYLLRGYLYSAIHNSSMTGCTVTNRYGHKYCYYRATGTGSEHNIRCDELENQVIGHLNYVDAVKPVNSEQFGLLLQVASVGSVLDVLPTIEQKRKLLALVLPRRAITVDITGIVSVALRAGFERSKLGRDDTNFLAYAGIITIPPIDETLVHISYKPVEPIISAQQAF